jgi:flagellar biosynthesis regulator FlbT
LLIDDTEDADASDKPSKAIDKIKTAAKPTITMEQLKQAKDYVMAGGDVEAIKTKYKLTAEQEKALTNEKRANTTKA